MLGLFWILSVWLSDGIPERFFLKKFVWKKKNQQRTKKFVKLHNMYRVKIHFTGDIVKFSSSLCDLFRAIS